MKAELFKPSPSLNRYIDSYMLVDIDWRNTEAVSTIWRLIPYGKISMLFLYGEPHEYSLNGPTTVMQRTRQAFMVGQLTQPIWLKFSGHTRLIKIQFKSSGAQRFLPLHMEEFKDMPSLDLEAIWGGSVNELLEQIQETQSDEERIGRLNTFLEKRLLPQQDMVDYVDYTIQQMKAYNGNLAIKGLEQKLGISTRQLERLFRAKIGLSPKEMGKIIRLNSAFSSLESDPGISLTSLSYEAGYYDQSHFSRDFKSIAGVSPSKLFSESSKELFVTHGQCFMKQKPAALSA
ncbi:AraC family transcriptional regulator [Pontibacter cellulosilyticus]|uniref:AraC family transcriptional regulator n=1 Tax=Pontibacter cellulosilyticus TaxID=1720253 RepID=A0A923SHN8_9BACT|nr:helix-turn-helix domain-containing protein [Pontibacter cellulosilyticus]MBC5991944.1 AraC family transcriptional regulator [Pontibacter cellulosilyticus]